MAIPKTGITKLIQSYQKGDREALEKLLPLVYSELRKIARLQLRGRPGQTISPTALVHDAFLRLREKTGIEYRDRGHFFAVSAQCMRWVILDLARAKRRAKRGGGDLHIQLDEERVALSSDSRPEYELVALDTALTELQKQDERLYKVVELRFLGGMSVEETAKHLGTSPATVKRDWQMAKLWLRRSLSDEENA